MNRVLPELTVEGTVFLVDAQAMKLYEKENPLNVTSFRDIFFNGIIKPEGIICGFDREHKRLGAGSASEQWNSSMNLVLIPPFIEIDPVGLARRQGLSENTFLKMFPARDRHNAIRVTSRPVSNTRKILNGYASARKLS